MIKLAIKPRTWRLVRRLIQAASLIFFLALVIWTARDARGALHEVARVGR